MPMFGSYRPVDPIRRHGQLLYSPCETPPPPTLGLHRLATACAYTPDERIKTRASTQGFENGINGRDSQHNAVSGLHLSPTATSSPASTLNTLNTPPEQLAERVRQLEQQLQEIVEARNGKRAAPSAPLNHPLPHTPDYSGPGNWQAGGPGALANGVQPSCTKLTYDTEEDTSSAVNVNTNAILAKSRYLGNSHWIHGVTLFPRLMTFTKCLQSEKDSEVYHTVAACKTLGRQIKAARVPSILSLEFGTHMPSKDLADELLESYFRSFETVSRILHVPSFRLEYGRYWQNPKGAREVFVIQLQLCLALGSVLRDDTFSLRNLAVRWVYEARLWLLQPSEKSRLNLSGLQTWCLLHIARDVCGVGGGLVWAYAGTLMRTALYIGLHRDPVYLPKMPLLMAETRRRVWATILEFLVRSSMDSGGPPMISTNDYDTQPPGNYNDEDLLADSMCNEIPQPKPETTFTNTSIQIAFLKSIKTRLDIAAYLNGFRTDTSYDKSLFLNSRLTTATRSLDAILRTYQSQQPGPTMFQLRIIDVMMQRYFLALHLPWLGPSKDDPRYYFSRKQCVDIGLRYHREAKSHGYIEGADGRFKATDDFGRLLVCGAGCFRYIGTQCLLTVNIELLWELEERLERARGLGLSSGYDVGATPGPAATSAGMTPGMGMGLIGCDDSEMLDIVRHSTMWTRARVRAGEVNIKGYLLTSAILAEAEGLLRGASVEELEQGVKTTCFNVSKDSLNLLKELYAVRPIAGNSVAALAGVSEQTRAPRHAGVVGNQVSVDGAEAGLPSMEPRHNEQIDGSWDWDFDPGLNLNFNFSLGGMDLVFGNPGSF
ncbi:hypothetical protein VPNG_07912 [Cytospora leucostoma]|uniref:Xylanolytic transcriptional activator regulatory domain-containing protein n=1 Tax=Cytospora leucostoma TaxID=1230097 RepID=A0A423WAW5_9PEZI|nr:hypothetical protein VPNG_07912 [Cytospora leucostoma]